MALKGTCHCGRYQYELTGADLSQASSCDCKHCRKAGCLWLPVSSELVYRCTRNDQNFVRYKSQDLEKDFCGFCGSTIVAEHISGPLRGRAVNIRCLLDINPFDFDPRSERSSTGAEPLPTPIAGRCDCGKIEVQLLQPLEKLEIREDNCSICARNAWVGIYPAKCQVVIKGQESTQDYSFGRRFNGFPFCKTCGIHAYQNLYGPPQSVVEAMPEARRQAVAKMLDIQPVNVRVFDELVVSDHDVQRCDEGTEGYETNVLAKLAKSDNKPADD